MYVLKTFLSSDPVRLIGEFQFNLQSLKEIKVSDSFLTLDVDSQKCQNIETYNDCKTRLYIKNMMQKCGCLTLSHIMSEEVCKICKERLKTVALAANLFYSSCHMSASLALGTM